MRASTREDYEARILRAVVHLENHLDEPPGLETLAQVACFAPHHFHRVFRGMVGEPVAAHVRRLRLERAARALCSGSRGVLDVALEAGYNSHEGFTRAFHEFFGVSPSEYRAGSRPRLSPLAPPAVEIVRREECRVVFVRHVGPYDQAGTAWSRLAALAGSGGLMGPRSEFLGILHDDPEVTPPERLRYDAALVPPAGLSFYGTFGTTVLAAGDYAITRHRGPYSTLAETYARLCGGWLPSSGREPRAAPALESYRNNPQSTPPEDLVTDIYIPLE